VEDEKEAKDEGKGKASEDTAGNVPSSALVDQRTWGAEGGRWPAGTGGATHGGARR
jgi:hypothetical protein